MALISYDDFNIDSQILRKLEEGYTSRKIKEYFKQHGAMPDSGVVETFTIPSNLMEEYKQFFYAKEYEKELKGNKVLLFYEAGFNNLSNDLINNINAIKSGYVPDIDSNEILLVFSHLPVSAATYSADTSAVLNRIYKQGGEIVEEELITTREGTPIAYDGVVSSILNVVRELFPDSTYGVVFSSHATGWLPMGYSVAAAELYDEVPRGRITLRSWGQEYYNHSGKTYSTEVEIKDLAAAIPFKLDYVIFDACLMSTVEVAWEFKDKTKYFIASPCEVPADGFGYNTIASRLLQPTKPDLEGVCMDYFEKYASRYGCAITMVDCDALQPLADTCQALFSKYRTELKTLSGVSVQTYDKLETGKTYCAFFDLKDMIREAGATEKELDELQNSLNQALAYERHTNFFGTIQLASCCGLSTYLPATPDYSETTYHGTQFLDGWYKANLKWNTATGFIQ